MWFDRFTNTKCFDLPMQIDSGRYVWEGKHAECLNGHSDIYPGEILVSDGSERCSLNQTNHQFLMPDKNRQQDISLFENAIATIGRQLEHDSKLMSPMLPSAVVDADSHLLPLEKKLQIILEKGHLHQISHRPRLDIRYEEEITDVARAKRLAKGALVHLASHSECWQRQTLSGVVPKKVKARFSEDDFHIYENRVYARLLDKLDTHLTQRIRTVEQLNDTLDKALRFYDNRDIHHRLSYKVCDLWGQTFDEEATLETLTLLEETLTTLRAMHHSICNLKQSGLYLLINRNTQIGGALHRTNILNHDAHYRYLSILWEMLSKNQQRLKSSPAEQFVRNQELSEYYCRYVGLHFQHALKPYSAEVECKYESQEKVFVWAGREFKLTREGFDWTLVENREQVDVLRIKTWLGFHDHNYEKSNSLIAFSSIDQELKPSIDRDNAIPLSPMDLYGVERLGWFVDRTMTQFLVANYGEPIQKLPQELLDFLSASNSKHKKSLKLTGDIPPSLCVLEDVSNDFSSALIKLLRENNAHEQADSLILRIEEIKVLQQCPVCDSRNIPLKSQANSTFSLHCDSCRTNRYLIKNRLGERDLLLKVNNEVSDSFSSLGRWFSGSN
ncbi:hypothetical protein ACFQ45_17030 [Rhodanobacter aciditrophus]|uniref:DUF2357 domain-containing protein n=1 Tax=Rhodanobacter aciditrophus TaxID=1623218 RepID=A0ABW4B8T3_9GAMM